MGFGFASIFGYIAQRIHLSPILGYLIAGYLIGPFSPGYSADVKIAEQLAEIGVVLMMFGVGLHFKWQDLLRTCAISVPGAIIQTFVATTVGALLLHYLGWTWEASIIFGLATGVASTVVLVRVLSDNHLLHTTEGHIAVGWLIVEDLITIMALLLIPFLGTSLTDSQSPFLTIGTIFSLALIKFIVLTAIMFTLGKRIVAYLLSKVMITESHELFTLSILAITFAIAVGSGLLLGTSIVLGAFVAGIVIGQTPMRQKVSLNAISLKDAFSVIFFLSIGMLFNPAAVIANFGLFLAILGIILIVKPLTAFLITVGFKYPSRTAIVIALALAQIGEFSFILGEEANKYKILPDDGYDIIIACAIFSISINPLLFKFLPKKQSG